MNHNQALERAGQLLAPLAPALTPANPLHLRLRCILAREILLSRASEAERLGDTQAAENLKAQSRQITG